jgi:hypothetical protein
MEDQESEGAIACEGKRFEVAERAVVVADRSVPVSVKIENLLAELERKTVWLT